jgi:hypothetical protein
MDREIGVLCIVDCVILLGLLLTAWRVSYLERRLSDMKLDNPPSRGEFTAWVDVINGWIAEIRAINARQKRMVDSVREELDMADCGEPKSDVYIPGRRDPSVVAPSQRK